MSANLFSIFFTIIFCFLSLIYSQMVSVPGGIFTMGDNNGERDEAPARTVTLFPYKIDKYEVSYAMYDSCVKQGACSKAHYDDGKCIMWTSSGIKKVKVPLNYRSSDFPVVCVSWHQARQYCRYKGKRLPTEAQWENAALAGKEEKYAWGNQSPDKSVCTQPSNNKPVKSGSYSPNGWGMYDMTGNVWEWTNDWYERDYYELSIEENPSGSSVGRYRVIRGGGWYSSRSQLRIKNRQWFAPEYGEVSIGVRCVK